MQELCKKGHSNANFLFTCNTFVTKMNVQLMNIFSLLTQFEECIKGLVDYDLVIMMLFNFS